jgi:hypothetical protein
MRLMAAPTVQVSSTSPWLPLRLGSGIRGREVIAGFVLASVLTSTARTDVASDVNTNSTVWPLSYPFRRKGYAIQY